MTSIIGILAAALLFAVTARVRLRGCDGACHGCSGTACERRDDRADEHERVAGRGDHGSGPTGRWR